MTGLKYLCITLLTLSLLAFSYMMFLFPNQPLNANKANVFFQIQEGSTVKSIISQLEEQHIIRTVDAPFFYGYIKLKGLQKGIQAGEYVFPLNMTPVQLLQKFIKGDGIIHSLTVTEGMTFAQMLRAMQFHPAIKKTLWGKEASDIMLLLGETGSPEGLFFPDTYHFKARTTDKTLLLRARKTMVNKLANAWERRDRNIVIQSPYEALILASIIEKETGSDNEREKISGVFQRRIQKKMRLQADPTVVYGIKDYNGRITKEDLLSLNPYNTYRHAGLPPSPIALPGIKSIEAALHPDKSEALYFVSKGDGTHIFSNTLEEHNQAVAQYIRISSREPKREP
ncbi:MAG: endolytic transglycosylase MltG [Candidatus Berkiella sp.]